LAKVTKLSDNRAKSGQLEKQQPASNMNTPNPLIPQGALERHSKGKSTVRIAILTIVSIHAVFFTGLLMQGCRRDDTKPSALLADAATNPTATTVDSAYYPTPHDLPPAAPIQSNPPSAPPSGHNSATYASEAPASTLPIPIPNESAAEAKSYTIVRGDTLAKIARANGVSVTALTRSNPGVEPSRLKPGQKLQIPVSTAAASAASATAGIGFVEPAKPDLGAADAPLYTVKRGETLTRIAKAHGTTVRALREANQMKSDRLNVGQKLRLPSPGAAGAKLTANTMAQVNPAEGAGLR
jgi:LysM repeat protein